MEKKRIYTILFIALFIFITIKCTKSTAQPDETFKVRVIALETDCGKPLIDFNERDSNRLSKITNVYSSLRYYAYNLSEEYHVAGREIIIAIKIIGDNDLG